MRLTDTLLRTSDECTAEQIRNALLVAAAGRFGLLPAKTPFEVSVSVDRDRVNVESISCLALTRNASLIDCHFDSRFSGNLISEVKLPQNTETGDFLLLVSMPEDNEWKECGNDLEQPSYRFSLINCNSSLPDDAFPVARIVNNDYSGMCLDNDFVPPCLFVSSHDKFIRQKNEFIGKLKELEEKSMALLSSQFRVPMSVLLLTSRQLRIRMDKDIDTLSPVSLFASVQECASGFLCACGIDTILNLNDADKETFNLYVNLPYTYKDVAKRIDEGLKLCYTISTKLEAIKGAGYEPVRKDSTHVAIEAPVIRNSDLVKDCKNRKVTIPVYHSDPNAEVLFTIDGTESSMASNKAKRTRDGWAISFNNGFKPSAEKEPDKSFTIKLKAVCDGQESETAQFVVTTKKNTREWNGINI